MHHDLPVLDTMSDVAGGGGGDEGASQGGSLTDLLLDDRYSEIQALILQALPERQGRAISACLDAL